MSENNQRNDNLINNSKQRDDHSVGYYTDQRTDNDISKITDQRIDHSVDDFTNQPDDNPVCGSGKSEPVIHDKPNSGKPVKPSVENGKNKSSKAKKVIASVAKVIALIAAVFLLVCAAYFFGVAKSNKGDINNGITQNDIAAETSQQNENKTYSAIIETDETQHMLLTVKDAVPTNVATQMHGNTVTVGISNNYIPSIKKETISVRTSTTKISQSKETYHAVKVFVEYPNGEGVGNEYTVKHGDTFNLTAPKGDGYWLFSHWNDGNKEPYRKVVITKDIDYVAYLKPGNTTKPVSTTKPTSATKTQYTPDLSEFDDSGSCGKNVYWGINKSKGELRILGIGQMKSGVAAGDWIKYSEIIKKVIIDDGVTSIGSFAFSNCKNISEVKIASSVKSIENGAFTSCISLQEINIPSGTKKISNSAFQQCTSLKSINVNPSNTTFSSVSGVLFNKNKTIILRYPPAKSESSYSVSNAVNKIGEMSFFNCQNLSEIILPSSLRTIESNAFWDCKNLEKITIPDSVTEIGPGAFSNCYSLKTIDIPQNITTVYGSAFTYCNSLKSINVNPNNKYYKSIDGVLYSRDGKILIHYPASKSTTVFSVPYGVTTIDPYAFAYAGLTSIDIPTSVATIGLNAFEGCTRITSITLPASVTVIEKTVFYKWKSTQTIYIKAYKSPPEGWNSGWNYNSQAKIVWNA